MYFRCSKNEVFGVVIVNFEHITANMVAFTEEILSGKLHFSRSLCENNGWEFCLEISLAPKSSVEAATEGPLQKKLSLKIWQYSQEITYVRVSF